MTLALLFVPLCSLATWVKLSGFIRSAEEALRTNTSRADVVVREEDVKGLLKLVAAGPSAPLFAQPFVAHSPS